MMQQWLGPMLRRMIGIEEKLDVLLQASGLAGPPAAQPRQPPAEEGAAHAGCGSLERLPSALAAWNSWVRRRRPRERRPY